MYKIIAKEKYKISHWSGGKTTEVYIFPEDSSYAHRDFLFRLSSATVETEESTFTKLDGIHRILIILKGKATLKHEKHHEIELYPYDIDEFEGHWDTKSLGKVEDFNVMLKDCQGEVSVLEIEKQWNQIIETKKNYYWEFFYCTESDLRFRINEQEVLLHKGNLLCVDIKSGEMAALEAINLKQEIVKCIRVIVAK